ncbi:MAG TPA: anhydro-N-acetylmuramic acid kinase, partial [Bacteroidales bacterium]|nr:anhydro-N-acetylmuramic acid kinase [Bacteroidales bacterium]
MEIKGEYIVVGAMSGTSLDGLDIAICKFNIFNNNVSYEIVGAETIDYNEQWQKILQNAFMFSGYDLYKTDLLYGKFIGEEVLKLVNKYKITPLLIASHGHTIFHQPSEQLTLQIGSGAAISSVTGIPVVSDFRISDVLLGGQGAPLVPMGEKILFKGINSFLNIGGFANISFHNNDSKVIAWDVCP